MKTRIERIQDRWDALAAKQLRAELEQLAADNQRLTQELDRALVRADQAERWAESWRDDFYRSCEANGTQPRITMDGHLVAVQQRPAIDTGVPL